MAKTELKVLKRRANRIKCALAKEWGMWNGAECPTNQVVAQECGKRMGLERDISRKQAAFVLVEYWQKFHGGEPTPVVQTVNERRAAVRRVDFYSSKDWKLVRYKALVACGAKCQCCGATAESSGRPLHVDHVKPRSRYPELELDVNNLQVLCEACNLGKSAWDETDWRVVAAQHSREVQ